MKIFITAFFQIFLVAANTVFLSKGLLLGIVVSSFGINWIWTHNVRRTVMSTETERITYSLGATCGAVCGYYASQGIMQII